MEKVKSVLGFIQKGLVLIVKNLFIDWEEALGLLRVLFDNLVFFAGYKLCRSGDRIGRNNAYAQQVINSFREGIYCATAEC